jgi:hypothetical protein
LKFSKPKTAIKISEKRTKKSSQKEWKSVSKVLQYFHAKLQQITVRRLLMTSFTRFLWQIAANCVRA